MKKLWHRLMDAASRGRRFVNHDIWRIGLPGEQIPSGFIIKQVRVAILLVKSIAEETLLLRAAALSFATLLFIVPFLVFMFSIIQTFHLGDSVYSLLSEKLDSTLAAMAVNLRPEAIDIPVQPGAAEPPAASDAQLRDEMLRLVFPWWETLNSNGQDFEDPIQMLVNLAEKGATNSKALSISGILFVLTTVFGLMRNVEWAFNRIWGVRRSRSYFRTTSDYLLITLLLPVAAAVVLGITAALASPYVQELLGPLSGLLRGGQFALVTLSFAIIYFFVPNTRVRFRNALIGGMFAGVLWLALSWAYVHAQVGMARYTLFFSTFAAFPLLLMWIYSSWIVLLTGTIISFAYQNEKTFAMERMADKAPYAYREALTVRAILEITRRFKEGLPGLSAAHMAAEWNAPLRLLNETLDCLAQAHLVTPCATEPVTYQPARSPENTRIRDVINALRESGKDPSLLRQEEIYGGLYQDLETANNQFLNTTLADAAAQLDTPGG